MILLLGRPSKLIPHILKEIFLLSTLSMLWLTHLILTCILGITQRGRKWTSHNTIGKREKTTPLETYSTSGGRRTTSMAKSSSDYPSKETTWVTGQTQCQHTTPQKKIMKVSSSRPTKQKLISLNLGPLTTWQRPNPLWEWRVIKFTTRMINMTRGRNRDKIQIKVRVLAQEDINKEGSWLIGKTGLCPTQRKRWRKRESRLSNKCCKMKRR